MSELHNDRIVLDRDWQGLREIPYDYLVIATGTKLRAPGTMHDDEKPLSVRYLQGYQKRLKDAKSVAVIGGGAVGVQSRLISNSHFCLTKILRLNVLSTGVLPDPSALMF